MIPPTKMVSRGVLSGIMATIFVIMLVGILAVLYAVFKVDTGSSDCNAKLEYEITPDGEGCIRRF